MITRLSLGLDGRRTLTTGLAALMLMAGAAFIALNMKGLLSTRITEIVITALGVGSVITNLLGSRLENRKWQVLIMSMLGFALTALGGVSILSSHLTDQTFRIGAFAIAGSTAILTLFALYQIPPIRSPALPRYESDDDDDKPTTFEQIIRK